MTSTTRLRLAHLSDPHFGHVAPAVRAALLGELQTHPPDLYVITGNLTWQARRTQFVQAREFLEGLPRAPRVCLPGNRDLPRFDLVTRLVKPYDHYRSHLGRELEPLFADERVAVVSANTTGRLHWERGVLRGEQIAGTAIRLSRLDVPFRVVATHHPLAAVAGSAETRVPQGSAAALDRWIAAGADLFLAGHLHLPCCLEAHTADRRQTSLLLQAGSCFARAGRNAVNSYNVVTLLRTGGERRMSIERRDYDESSGRFVLARRYVGWSMMDRARTGLNGWRLMAEA